MDQIIQNYKYKDTIFPSGQFFTWPNQEKILHNVSNRKENRKMLEIIIMKKKLLYEHRVRLWNRFCVPGPGFHTPKDCQRFPFQGAGSTVGPQFELVCDLRTINSEFDRTNFSVIPAPATHSLTIQCSDSIPTQSRYTSI